MTIVQGDTMIAELTAIRSRVRQHHSQIATVLLDNLIRSVEEDARIRQIVNDTYATLLPATNGKRRVNGHSETCHWGWKYSKKGAMTRNRKHVCGPECSWDQAQVSEWLRTTPYRVGPNEYIQSRLVPVPPCANCNRKRGDHWEAVSNDAGLFVGFRAIQECSYAAA